jgi:hypothetical protein
MAKGIGIAALIVAIVAFFVPIVGIAFSIFALILATLAALGGDRAYATATPIVVAVNTFGLSPSMWLVMGLSSATLQFVLMMLAMPYLFMVVAWVGANRGTIVVSKQESSPGPTDMPKDPLRPLAAMLLAVGFVAWALYDAGFGAWLRHTIAGATASSPSITNSIAASLPVEPSAQSPIADSSNFAMKPPVATAPSPVHATTTPDYLAPTPTEIIDRGKALIRRLSAVNLSASAEELDAAQLSMHDEYQRVIDNLNSIPVTDTRQHEDSQKVLQGLWDANAKLLKAKLSAEDKASRPHHYVTIEKFSWSKDGFGTVMMANLALKNGLASPVKDIEVTCTHSAPSGTQIDSNTRTIYQRIESNGTKRVSEFNMGFINSQTTRSGCEVTKVTVLPAPPATKPTPTPSSKSTVQKQTSSAPLPLH